MIPFELYIHGTPKGHKIWATGNALDYISTFYNHDSPSGKQVILQIDICGGDTFYTYVLRKDMLDADGRPGAFFAITLCFKKSYCTNTATLFKLFTAVYDQVCLKAFLKTSESGLQYRVRDFEDGTIGNTKAVQAILTVVTPKIEQMIMPFTEPLPDSIVDTYGKIKKYFNIKEVDSPLFVDDCLNYSVIVSPEIATASVQLQKANSDLKFALIQNNELEETKNRLDAKVRALRSEAESLTIKLQDTATTVRQQYDEKLKQVQAQLESVTSERDNLRIKIEEAFRTIRLMDQPIQQLAHLMSGRFPDKREDDGARCNEMANFHNQKIAIASWQRLIRLVLLLLPSFLCGVLIYINSIQNDRIESLSYTESNKAPTLLNTAPVDSLKNEEPIDSINNIGIKL